MSDSCDALKQLAPGSYRFRLKAANEAGIASQDEAVFAFEILPTLFQTTAFKIACGAALLLLLYGAHRYRVYLAARRLTERLHAYAREKTAKPRFIPALLRRSR